MRASSVTSVMSGSLWPRGLQPARLLCLCDYLGKNSGVGSISLPGALPNPAIGTHISGSSCDGRWILTTSAIYKAQEEGRLVSKTNSLIYSFMNLAKLMLHFCVPGTLSLEIAQQIWCTWLLPLWSSRFSGARR